MKDGVTKGDQDKFFAEARGVERDLFAELEAKAKRGWLFGWSQMGLAVLALGVAFTVGNKPQPEPVMLRVDNTTGSVERITTLAEDQIASSEADDMHWINRFIISRESYDYNSIQATYDLTMLLSGADVARDYSAIYSGPNARDAVWQNNIEQRVEVRSITPDIENRTAVVRFTTKEINKGRGTTPPQPKYWIANLRYTYLVNAEMTEQDRWKNPKAFQVLSYRADPEVFTAQ